MLFSAEFPWCYFCAEIKVLGMTWKSTEIIFGIYKNTSERIKAKGPTPCPRGWGRAYPLGTPPASWAPLVLHWPQLQLYIFVIGEKKIGEKDSSRFTIQNRLQALNSLGRADPESVRGSGEGNPSPSSSSTFLHHQFHDAHRCAWVIPSCNRVSFVRVWSLVSIMFWDWCFYDFAMLNTCH